MNPRLLLRLFLIVILGIVATSFAKPFIFSDDFSDGLSDAWLLEPNQFGYVGNWRVENGTLVQDTGGDGMLALVKGVAAFNQTVDVDVSFNGPSGYGGVMVWYQDPANWTVVGPGGVTDVVNWIGTNYSYPFGRSFGTWYHLRVEANGTKGTLNVYVNHTFLFTHKVSSGNRSGLTGLQCGNAGAYFDNFVLRLRASGKQQRQS